MKRQLSLALDEVASGPIRLVSMCAGQGRDVIDVLETHPRGPDVNARLVEFDPEIAEGARSRARRAGLSSLEVIVGDAGLADSYQGSVPADVLVVCGVFDNLTLDDITRTITMLPSLAARRQVIWTRHRRPPDLTSPCVRRFDDVDSSTWSSSRRAVAVHGGHQSTAAASDPFKRVAAFTFVGDGDRPA